MITHLSQFQTLVRQNPGIDKIEITSEGFSQTIGFPWNHNREEQRIAQMNAIFLNAARSQTASNPQETNFTAKAFTSERENPVLVCKFTLIELWGGGKA